MVQLLHIYLSKRGIMKNQILDLAKAVIEANLYNKKIPSKNDIEKKYLEFALKKATFVTLKLNGNLRGCIGSLVAHRELYDDIVSNSFSAAFRDPRFKPLSIDEYKNTTIEISLLSDAVMVKYDDTNDLKSKIEVGSDGIILKKGNNQATFLPQVWEELTDFDIFFKHLCLKAGLSENSLELHPEIYKYQVQKIK